MNELLKIIKELNGKAYMVGGTVRDEIICRPNTDVDIEVFGIFPHILVETLKLSKNKNIDFIFNEKFKTIKLIIKDKNKHIDISFPRCEVVTGEKHTDFEIYVDPFSTTYTASLRRDFTMNSIMKCLETGRILDFHNGIRDIKNKEINIVNEKHFGEDPIRPLRAIEFACRLGFKINNKIIEIGRKTNFGAISKERIKDILDKILLSDNVNIGFKYLKEMNFFRYFLKEFNLMSSTRQSPIYHPEGNVWNHTLEVLKRGSEIKYNASNPLYFMYACLFHDIGKVYTTKNNFESYGHDTAGASIVSNIMSSITNERDLIEYVTNLTLTHMKIKSLLKFKHYKRAKFIVENYNIYDALGLAKADNERFDLDKHCKVVDKLYHLKTPIITGEILKALGLTQGVNYGIILNEMYDLQLQGYNKEALFKIVLNRVNKINKEGENKI